jgi:NAD+ kinase
VGELARVPDDTGTPGTTEAFTGPGQRRTMSDPRVALVGDDGSVERAAASAGVTVAASLAVSDPRDTERLQLPEDVSAVLAVGERALIETVLSEPTSPVVGVDDGSNKTATGVHSRKRVLDALTAGTLRHVEHSPLSVRVGDEHVGRAALDAGLVTSEPARISEYSIHDAEECLKTLRADGVVVATPLGSGGYNRAVDGPLLAPGTGLAVSPVAPFATSANTRVLRGTVKFRVERDEGDVSLLLDDREVSHVPSKTPVVIETDGGVTVALPPRQ